MHVKWHPYECQDPRFANWPLHCNKMINYAIWGQRPITVPDIIGKTSIRVYSADSAHSAGWWAVFRHVHVVSGSREPGRLVCVQHCYSDWGPVLEGPSTQEARIHYRVEDLDREGVGAPALVVYSLWGTKDEAELIGLKYSVSKCIIAGWDRHLVWNE